MFNFLGFSNLGNSIHIEKNNVADFYNNVYIYEDSGLFVCFVWLDVWPSHNNPLKIVGPCSFVWKNSI